MTEDNIEKARKTFPENTVYMCYSSGETSARTFEYYAKMGKTYSDCSEAMKKSESGRFKERQDKDLFEIVRNEELRKEEKKSDFQDFVDRLTDIGNEIDNLIYEMEGE